MNVTPDLADARLQLAKVNGQFGPELVRLDLEKLPPVLPPDVMEVWRSATHIVCVRKIDAFVVVEFQRTVLTDGGEFENDPIGWWEMERLKQEIGMDGFFAVEVYPPHAHALEHLTARVLWILEHTPTFGWKIQRPQTEVQAVAPNGKNGHALKLVDGPKDADEVPAGILNHVQNAARFMP